MRANSGSGSTNQRTAIAIGNSAGSYFQGLNAIAIAKKEQNQQQANNLSQEVKDINQQLKLLQEQNIAELELEKLLLQIPNLPQNDVPIGAGEEQNVVVATFGKIREFDFTPLAHDELGKNLKIDRKSVV